MSRLGFPPGQRHPQDTISFEPWSCVPIRCSSRRPSSLCARARPTHLRRRVCDPWHRRSARRAHSRAFFGGFLSEHQFALFAVLFDKGVVGIEGEKSGVVNIPDKRVKLPQLPTIDLRTCRRPSTGSTEDIDVELSCSVSCCVFGGRCICSCTVVELRPLRCVDRRRGQCAVPRECLEPSVRRARDVRRDNSMHN